MGPKSDPPSALMGPGLVCSTLHSWATDPRSAGACYVYGAYVTKEFGINNDASECVCVCVN